MGLYNISIALLFCIEFIILSLAIKLKNRNMLILMVIIIISFIYATALEYKYDKAFIHNENFYIAKVESLKEEVKYYNRYTLRLKSGKYKNYKILLYTNQNLEYGDIVTFSGKIERPESARNDKRF